MDDKGKIVGHADIDEGLALEIWTKGRMPRLVLANKVKNTKKMIHLAWVEKRDRKLSINGPKRGETLNYTVEGFGPAIQKILIQYVIATKFQVKLLKFFVDLEKVVHTPELITDKKDLALLSEDKRCALWLADCTGPDKKEGVFQPFFPYNEAEAAALNGERLRIVNGGSRGPDALAKAGVMETLKKANPRRWLDPIRVGAAAMLLGFSFCEADGSEFSDKVCWEEKKPGPAPSAMNRPTSGMKQPVRLSAFSLHDSKIKGFGHKLTAYIRHFDAVDQIETRTEFDSDKALEAEGYSKSRRFDFQPGSIGDVAYRVTWYENEETGRMALGCVPKSVTSRHKDELIYTLPKALYDASVKMDTMSENMDDFFTMTQLVWAKQFKLWYDSVAFYVRPFSGLSDSKKPAAPGQAAPAKPGA
ncbi:MAG: hypothetical protein IJU98_07205 [Synergistaceae bacterium]|nr:hypothetical protein [Synergistaceae bacterium]